MITEALLSLVTTLVEWFASVTPDFGLDLGGFDLGSMWSALASGASALDGWLLVDESLAAAGMFLVVQVVMSGWGLIVWVYHQFWGSE